mgnify:FL=1
MFIAGHTAAHTSNTIEDVCHTTLGTLGLHLEKQIDKASNEWPMQIGFNY